MHDRRGRSMTNNLESRLLIALLILGVPSIIWGQLPALEKGSVGAARAIAEAQRRASEADASWRTSIKLTYLAKIPAKPNDQSDCMYPGQLRDKALGYLDYWQFEVLQ